MTSIKNIQRKEHAKERLSHTSVFIDREIWLRVRMLALKKETTATELMRQALIALLAKEGEK